ncbi:leucyl-cystinyl aminopeptidase-like [Melitaea cinxia]|uniref:leucyl-cystinyl aminopeptidase-like n=1 Tax=Melitaea cinxia TaxID=113334 RepID=UPI001E26F86A|nr:leucyl-cystinyl aminopeptidase-like [Melitaea cinxia]
MFCLAYFLLYIASSSAYVLEEECLNYTVYPVQYELTLYPYIYKDGNSFYYCDIIITIIANAPNVNIIELDARDLEIKSGSIQVLYNNINLVNPYRPYEFDNRRGKLFIYLKESLKQYSVSRTQYFVKISFTKQVSFNSEGIFLVEYEGDDRKPKYLFTTRLSPNKSKYFFPCFDNPQFEAVFKFRIYVAPQQPGVQYCNTSLVIAKESKQQISKDSYTIIEYAPSPQISLHQVGFHHSIFGSSQVITSRFNETLAIWAPASTLDSYNFVLRLGMLLINLIHEYALIDLPLVNGPINIVAVPGILNDYEIDSWNLLTIGDYKLANSYVYTSIKQIEQLTFDLAQQLSRIWLGNPGELQRTRWKEEWFKEGVATYMAYYLQTQYNYGEMLQQRRPIENYGVLMKHKAMAVDWHHSTPALATFNRTLAIEIPSRYKELVTMKTASLLWMVENWIGSEKFHQALVKYINSRRGKYISVTDFMINLDRDTVECLHQFLNGSTSSRVLNSWFHQSGYPVVNVQVLRDRSPNVVQLKQRKFSFSEQNRFDSNYLIPISYIVQNNGNCFNCLQPRFTIGGQTYTFRENLGGGWIILNRNASGYYRVNYDDETWRLIAQTLKQDHTAIDELNRAQIANDVFALYAAGDLREDIAIEVLDYLNKELSLVVWESVISGYELFKMEDVKLTKTLYEEWQQFLQRKISTLYRRLMVNIEQRPITRLFRSSLVEFACEIKYRPCLNEMRRYYADHINTKTRLNPDFRRACYYTIIHDARDNIGNKLNRFEIEDKTIAEHKVREENRFFYRIPVGIPKPLPIRMSTTTTTTTEVTFISTSKPANRGAALSISPFSFILAIYLFFILK